jgi:hypothetical protein
MESEKIETTWRKQLLELREVGVPRGLRVRDRLGLAGQAALAHEAADREARRVGELARL